MRRLAMAVIMTAALVGCGGGDDEEGGGELVVSAASSLEAAFTEVGGASFSFAGSDTLAAQIRQGAAVDVYAAANTSLPDQLYDEDLVEEPVEFAANKLVLAVPSEDARVTALEDLQEPGITIAVGSEDVPVGAYTREVLDALGPERSEAILANVRSEEPDVAGVVGKLTQGAVDAGFVYITDVEATNGALTAIALPAEVSPDVAYGVAIVKGTERHDEAEAFIESLQSGAGRAALAQAGFTLP